MSPCEGSCGSNAECVVISHKAVCHCRESYTGDPFNGCYFVGEFIISYTFLQNVKQQIDKQINN